MRILAFTKHNPKFEVYNRPEEDSFKYLFDKDRMLVCVADGITRDPKGADTLPDSNDVESIRKVWANYPNPSKAKAAADLVCTSFVGKVKKNKSNEISVREGFVYCNRKLYNNLNKNRKINYLDNDFAGCVAAAGVIEKDKLYYGFIADSGICIFDKTGKLKFKTPNEGPNSKGNINKEIKEKYHTSFKFSEGRKIIRRIYRNNPLETLSYGALTGEELALLFIKTGKISLNSDDVIIFYTDGMVPIIYSNGFKVNFRNEFKNLESNVEKNLNEISGAEGTLVAIILD